MEQLAKRRLLLAGILGAVLLLGVFVGLCGIGLSLGLRKLSLIGFFSAAALVVGLRLGVSLWRRKGGLKPNS